MARLLNGSTQYLTGSPVSIAYPFSVAVWFNVSSSATQNLWVAFYASGETVLHTLGITYNGGDAYIATSDANNAGDSIAISDGSLWTTNTWNLAVGVWATATDRKVYVNGSSGVGSSTVSRTASADINTVNVGREHQSGGRQYVAGGMAHLAEWFVELTAKDVDALAAGFAPPLVRPDGLGRWNAMFNDDGDRDHWNKFHLTAQNTPTYMQHPPIILPEEDEVMAFGSGSSGGGGGDNAVFFGCNFRRSSIIVPDMRMIRPRRRLIVPTIP